MQAEAMPVGAGVSGIGMGCSRVFIAGMGK